MNKFMLTKESVLDSMKQELNEMEMFSQYTKEDIEKFLSRFKDLDKFFDDAIEIVEYYFSHQKEYSNIDSFKRYLKEQMEFYVHSFSLEFDEKIELFEKLEKIEQSYDKLIYYWIDNPIQDRREKESNNSKWVIRWFKSIFGKIF